MYLALAPLCAGLVWVGIACLGRPALLLVGAAVMAAGVLTFRRNEDFRSEERIWTVTCAHAPANARARGSLGVALLAQPERHAEVRAHLEAARGVNPLDPETHFQLAGIYERTPAT